MHPLLRQILQLGQGSQDTDADLLRRFVDAGDTEAFTQLVRRYGGLVWGQCRHLLTSEADADDAFQATFLVLARSAKSIRAVDRLGPWLHGVAYRVCQNARRQVARRRKHEQAQASSEAGHPVADSAWESLLAAVHEELHGLPENLRVAFVLCYLEGKSTSEAAEQLGLKLGTFSSHLSRARERLLARLSARGLTGAVGVLATLTCGTVRGALVQRVVEMTLTRVIPATILTLTKGVLMMGITKLKLTAACVLVAGVLTLGGLWSVQGQTDSGGPNSQRHPLFLNPLQKTSSPENVDIQAEIEALRALANAREHELKARQAALEQKKAAELAKKNSEFRYLPQQPGYAPTMVEFEKTIREGEKGGYRFVGIVPMRYEENRASITLSTFVFRRIAAQGGMGMMGGGEGGAGMMGPGFDPYAPALRPK